MAAETGSKGLTTKDRKAVRSFSYEHGKQGGELPRSLATFIPRSTPAAELNGTVPPIIAREIFLRNSTGTLIPGEFPLRKLSLPEVKHFGRIKDNLPSTATRLSTLSAYGGVSEVLEMFAAAGGKYKKATTERVAGVDFKKDGSTLTVFGSPIDSIQVMRKKGKGVEVVTLDNPIIMDAQSSTENGASEKGFLAISQPTVKIASSGEIASKREVTVLHISKGQIDMNVLDTARNDLSEGEKAILAVAERLGEQRKPILLAEPPHSETYQPGTLSRIAEVDPQMPNSSPSIGAWYSDSASSLGAWHPDVSVAAGELIDGAQQDINAVYDKILQKVRKENVRSEKRAKHEAGLIADFGKNIMAARRLRQRSSE